MTQLNQVDLTLKSNVYFDGKCVSHTIHLADGTRKTVGVIFPSTLRFTTGAPEVMEVIGGTCKVLLDGETTWSQYTAGEKFSVPGNSAFDIEVIDFMDYVCHFG
jgi:purine/pyrimidine-nucleoside phosphorylase